MKLIDMLAEDGLNGWQWPDGVKCITQDNGSSIYKGVAFGYHKAPYLKKNIWLANNGTGHADAKIKKYDVVADDWDTAIITRDQYEAALAAKNEGWIDFAGDECPVSGDTVVEVKYRNPLPGHINNRQACYFSWSHEGDDGDIIAYRLHQPQEVEQAEADDEADLNECIGQDAAPFWNGEGLPPVGCECEWQDKNTKQWNPVKVVYASEWVTVIREINKEKGDDLVEIAIENYGDDARLKFRPTRSEAERKRDAAKNAIAELCRSSSSNGHSADLIYDAIAAGEITGLKLED